MAGLVGKGQVLIELGSGSSLKIQILLAALAPSVYVPVDISRDHLLASADALAERFPGLCIRAVCADYSVPFDLPLEPDGHARAAFFPGSSIGNFEPAQARALLDRVVQILGPGGRLLIGVDLVKDCAVLEAAYNDSQGVTAEFNRNLLATYQPGDPAATSISTPSRTTPSSIRARTRAHLPARAASRCTWSAPASNGCTSATRTIAFRAGESIHTENSYKYDLPGFGRLAADAGFATEQVWTDPEALFSVHCLRSAVHSDTQ